MTALVGSSVLRAATTFRPWQPDKIAGKSMPDPAPLPILKSYSAHRPNYGVYSRTNRLSWRGSAIGLRDPAAIFLSRPKVGEWAAEMRTMGLIGGMSLESTAVYYRRLNEQVRARLGGLHPADILMRSVDFDPIVGLQKQGGRDEASRSRADIARDPVIPDADDRAVIHDVIFDRPDSTLLHADAAIELGWWKQPRPARAA